MASIAVHDSAIGVPARYHGRIFDRFFQVDSRASRAHGGIGLGLAIAKELVEQNDGSLHVASKEGQGSCFTIELPLLE